MVNDHKIGIFMFLNGSVKYFIITKLQWVYENSKCSDFNVSGYVRKIIRFLAKS